MRRTRFLLAPTLSLAASLALASAGSAEGAVFSKRQTGIYNGSARVGAVVKGRRIPSQRASSRIRLLPDLIVLDGARINLSGGKVDFRYYSQGITMICQGDYTKTRDRLRVRGTVSVLNGALIEAGKELEGTWTFDLFANGRLANYSLRILFPDPSTPGVVLATISSTGNGEKSP